MLDENSVTAWIDGVKVGDQSHIERLWDRYYQRLVRLAAARLPAHSRRSFDEEDVALSAFQAFCLRAGHDDFPQLRGRDDLWRLLATITVRKAIDTLRRQSRQKRGGGNVLGESALLVSESVAAESITDVLSREPTPEQAAQFSDECRRYLARLDGTALRTIALRRLEGQSAKEIAKTLNVSTKTVERKLQLIRAIWSTENAQS